MFYVRLDIWTLNIVISKIWENSLFGGFFQKRKRFYVFRKTSKKNRIKKSLNNDIKIASKVEWGAIMIVFSFRAFISLDTLHYSWYFTLAKLWSHPYRRTQKSRKPENCCLCCSCCMNFCFSSSSSMLVKGCAISIIQKKGKNVKLGEIDRKKSFFFFDLIPPLNPWTCKFFLFFWASRGI